MAGNAAFAASSDFLTEGCAAGAMATSGHVLDVREQERRTFVLKPARRRATALGLIGSLFKVCPFRRSRRALYGGV